MECKNKITINKKDVHIITINRLYLLENALKERFSINEIYVKSGFEYLEFDVFKNDFVYKNKITLNMDEIVIESENEDIMIDIFKLIKILISGDYDE